MAKLKKMLATVGVGAGTAEKYYFMSNPLLYASIGSIVGISEAPIADIQVIHRVEDLLLYGVLESIAVRTGTTSTNRKSVKLLCAADKASDAEKDLIDKVIPQGTITSVSSDLNAEDYLP